MYKNTLCVFGSSAKVKTQASVSVVLTEKQRILNKLGIEWHGKVIESRVSKISPWRWFPEEGFKLHLLIVISTRVLTGFSPTEGRYKTPFSNALFVNNSLQYK